MFMYCVLEIDVEMVKSEKRKNSHSFDLTILAKENKFVQNWK